MADAAVQIFKIFVKLAIYLSFAVIFVVMLNFVSSLITVTVNQSVLGDLMAIMQLWLPFNISLMYAWLLMAALLYLSYRVMIWAASYITGLLSS